MTTHKRIVQSYLQSPKPHPELWGLRYWSFDGQTFLVSPMRNTPWLSNILQAHALDESSVVEGRSGIHALHAPHAPTLHESLCAGCYILATRDYLCPVWGLVRPYGRTVIGPLGWRAEFAQIVALMTKDPRCLPVLAAHYGVPCFLFSAADDKEG